MFVLRRAVAGRLSVGLAHVRAPLRISIIVRPWEMVDVRFLIDPNDGCTRAAILGLLRRCRGARRGWGTIVCWAARRLRTFATSGARTGADGSGSRVAASSRRHRFASTRTRNHARGPNGSRLMLTGRCSPSTSAAVVRMIGIAFGWIGARPRLSGKRKAHARPRPARS
jgi:hypothetical protein